MIEDDATLRSALSALLREEGYSVAIAADGSEGLKMAITRTFDVILLDINQPDGDDFNVCRDIRQAGIAIPILILTTRTHMIDRLLGFRLGADDSVTKPFDTAELLARIEVLLRRVRVPSQQSTERAGTIKIDVRHSRVARDGKPVSMTTHEFQLLHYLLKRAGRCVSRGELLKTVWGYASNSTTRTIDMHIASLRKKLEVDPKSPRLILTLPKLGYMFVGSSGTYNRQMTALNNGEDKNIVR